MTGRAKTVATSQPTRTSPADALGSIEAQVDGDVPSAAPIDAGSTNPRLIRDSFAMPKAEYELLAVLKARLVAMARSTKKGELLRAGICALAAMSDAELRAAVERVPNLKTGRPKKAANDAPAKPRKKSRA